MSKDEVTVHGRVEIINLDAILEDNSLLMMAQEAREPTDDSFSRDYPSFLLTLESPTT
jgi:hypothetical protein